MQLISQTTLFIIISRQKFSVCFTEDVSVMCNLSQKIKETGIEIGKKEMIVKMHSKGYTIAQIADVAGMEEKRIEEIIKNEELLPA